MGMKSIGGRAFSGSSCCMFVCASVRVSILSRVSYQMGRNWIDLSIYV